MIYEQKVEAAKKRMEEAQRYIEHYDTEIEATQKELNSTPRSTRNTIVMTENSNTSPLTEPTPTQNVTHTTPTQNVTHTPTPSQTSTQLAGNHNDNSRNQHRHIEESEDMYDDERSMDIDQVPTNEQLNEYFQLQTLKRFSICIFILILVFTFIYLVINYKVSLQLMQSSCPLESQHHLDFYQVGKKEHSKSGACCPIGP